MSKLMVILLMHFFIDMCYCSLGSYNLPKFCPNASWNTVPVIFSDSRTRITEPIGIFIDLNNTVYVATLSGGPIQMWREGKNSTAQNPSIKAKLSVFVALNGDIYVNDGSQIKVWNSTTRAINLVMENDGDCYSLFLDIKNTIYCSLYTLNQVVKQSLNRTKENIKDLNNPLGIFVHTNFTLYVADNGNNRIRRFLPGEKNGVSVAGSGSSSLTGLRKPTAVVLDADGYLFITDEGGHIYGSGPVGFRCLVRCSSTGGSTGSVRGLRRLSFDSYGNIFATDATNNQILKFMLATNSCDVTTTSQEITTFSTSPPTTTILTTTATSEKTTTTEKTTTLSNPPSTTAILTTTTTLSTSPLTTTILIMTTTSTTKIAENLTTAIQLTTRSIISLSTNVVTTSYRIARQSPSYFIPERCKNPTQIGHKCNASNTPCSMLKPCQNKHICKNGNTLSLSYTCDCLDGFHGDNCQYNSRLCESNPCWNNGSCEYLTGKFVCHCVYGWKGTVCETKENFCILKNITCQNRGVCRPLFRGFKCECLGTDYYSGKFCEISSRKIMILKMASKSISFIAIIIMISTAMFIIIMDILKYCFGIDPTREERERIRRKRKQKKRKPIIQRFVYVNPPTISST